MKEPHLAREVIQAVRGATRLPFTIKIRSGWDYSGNQAMALAKIAADQGVDAIAMHPRTAGQGFRGNADWTLIKRLKKEIDLPVIGNGDIKTPEDAVRMMEETGCDAIMAGRVAMANPFIFSQIEDLVHKGNIHDPYRTIFSENGRVNRPLCDLFRGRDRL